jgi:hypothetical protein
VAWYRRVHLDRGGCRRIGLHCLMCAGLPHPQLAKVVVMFDFLMVAYGIGFFVLAILYVVACEKM